MEYLKFDPIAVFAGDTVIQKLGNGKTRKVKVIQASKNGFSEYWLFRKEQDYQHEMKRLLAAKDQLLLIRANQEPINRSSLNSINQDIQYKIKLRHKYWVPCILNYGTVDEELIYIHSNSLAMASPRDPNKDYGYEDYTDGTGENFILFTKAEQDRRQLRSLLMWKTVYL